MAKYAQRSTKATTSTTVGICSIECPGSNARRFKLIEAEMGSPAATLGTSNFLFEFNRSTAVATGTTIAFSKLDPADAPATIVFRSSLTVQGTNTADDVPLAIPLNQQATFRWVANPGSEIVCPATANAGLHVNTPVTGNTPSATVCVTIEEQ